MPCEAGGADLQRPENWQFPVPSSLAHRYSFPIKPTNWHPPRVLWGSLTAGLTPSCYPFPRVLRVSPSSPGWQHLDFVFPGFRGSPGPASIIPAPCPSLKHARPQTRSPWMELCQNQSDTCGLLSGELCCPKKRRSYISLSPFLCSSGGTPKLRAQLWVLSILLPLLKPIMGHRGCGVPRWTHARGRWGPPGQLGVGRARRWKLMNIGRVSTERGLVRGEVVQVPCRCSDMWPRPLPSTWGSNLA